MSTEPPAVALSGEERRAVLAQKIEDQVRKGARVDSQSDYQAVLVWGHRPNHILHFLIGLVTLSAWWIFVWLPIIIFGGEKRKILTVDEHGKAMLKSA